MTPIFRIAFLGIAFGINGRSIAASAAVSVMTLAIGLSGAFTSPVDAAPPEYPGGRVPGTGRSAVCPTTPLLITALVPYEDTKAKASTKTTAAQPIVWVYVPYSKSQGQTFELELSITDEQAEDPTKRTTYPIPLPEKPGIMPIALPSNTQLEVGKSYGWSLDAKCDSRKSVDIQFTIERVAALPNSPSPISKSQTNIDFYNQRGIWINTMIELFKLNGDRTILSPDAQTFLMQKLDGDDFKRHGMVPNYLHQILQQPIIE